MGKKIGTGGPRRAAPGSAPSGGDGPGERSVVPARCRERCQRSGGPRQGKRHRSAPRLPPQSRKAAPPPRLQHSRLYPPAGQGRAERGTAAVSLPQAGTERSRGSASGHPAGPEFSSDGNFIGGVHWQENQSAMKREKKIKP